VKEGRIGDDSMVESIKDLRKIVKKEGIEERGLAAVYRYISFYLTKILLHFTLNANLVSIIGVEIGIIASIFFLLGNPLYFTIGGTLLFLYTLFDYCDGEVARYYKNKGKYKEGLGGFFDWSNCLPRPLIIFSLSIGLMNNFGEINPIIFIGLGVIFSYFWFLNHVFRGLRKNLSKISIENDFKNEIYNKISSTFNGKFANILIRSSNFIQILLPKFRITYLDRGDVDVDSMLYKIRLIIRKTQSTKIFPFVFIFSGIVDFLLTSPNFVVFSVWIYFGISGIVLFILEEIMIKRYKKEI